MWVSTFHSMCARILRREAERLGYGSTFSIHDDDDRKRLVKRCLEALDIDPKRYPPEAIARQISDAKNQLMDAAAFREQTGGRFSKAAADVYERYERELLAMNAMDFDDLLMKTVQLLEQLPDRRQHYQRAFRYVLIDEYQDTNHAQYRLANLLAGEHRNLAVVGDDDQSIYSWRGADIRNILEFERDYPDAKVIRLEQNYRSTQAILDVANAVVTHNRQRKGKNLWTPRGQGAPAQIVEVNDERAEAQFVASEVQKLLEGEAGERAYRAARDRRPLPHQRAVARARGAVRALRDRLPGDRRAQVLRARRDPRRARLPDAAGEPRRHAAPAARRQRAEARAGRDDGGPPAGARRQRRRRACGRRPSRPTTCPASRRPPSTGCSASCASSRASRPGLDRRPVAEVVRSVLEESGYEDDPQAAAHARGRGPPREPRGVPHGRRPSTTAAPPSRHWTASCRRSRSTPTSTPSPTPASSSR